VRALAGDPPDQGNQGACRPAGDPRGELRHPEDELWRRATGDAVPGVRPGAQGLVMARRGHAQSNAGGSQRQLRVGELVRHALAEMLTRGDVHDPVLEGHMITVPEVRMTADLRLA